MKEPTLIDLGARLKTIDRQLVFLLARRMALSLKVGEVKEHIGKEIFRRDVEDERMTESRILAQQFGLNPNFLHSLMYLIISESCKTQTIRFQSAKKPADEVPSYGELKTNLLKLTEAWAKDYDKGYGKTFFATKTYLDFEHKIIEEMLKELHSQAVLLDLGCATGPVSFLYGPKFKRTVGYDISPTMVRTAKIKNGTSRHHGLEFKVADLDACIPEQNESVSCVIMNLGTAGDIQNLPNLVREIDRVLIRGGKFLLSFYNKDALVYALEEFLPWEICLAARINVGRNVLEVRHSGKKISIYAKACTKAEVEEMLGGFSGVALTSFPTLISFLPDALLHDKTVFEHVLEVDKEVSRLNRGAYLIATGTK